MKNKVNRASLGAKKNLNLFTWLLECSGNAAKIGLIPCQLRQQDGKNTAKTRQKDGKSSIYRRIITLLTLLLTLGVGQMWADKTIWEWKLYYWDGTENKWLGGDNNTGYLDFGIVSDSWYWKGAWAKTSDKNSNSVAVYYVEPDGTQNNFSLGYQNCWDDCYNKFWKNESGCNHQLTGSGFYQNNPGVNTIQFYVQIDGENKLTPKATYTIPGFTNLSATTVTFANTTVGGYSSKSIAYTHYGTAPTNVAARYSITGTDADQFSITALSETGAIIQFHPTSAGTKTATLVINDVHGKTTGSITLTGTTQYTVSYNKGSNGTGDNTTANKVYGTNLTLLGATFTRSGYYQTAWNTDADGVSGTSYALGGTYKAEAALTLYPTWSQWTIYSDGSQFGSAFAGTGNTNEYYLDINTSTTGFNAGALKFKLGTSNYHPVNCDLADGNWHDMSYYGDDGNFAWTAPPASNTNWRIFIKLDGSTWKVKAVRRYTVTYAGNGSDGGSAPTNSNTYATGETFSVASNSFTRTGYNFNIWNDGTSNYAPNATYTIGTQDVTLTAQWTAKSFTITFDKNSGTSGSDSQTTTYDATTSDITPPTRAGFTFEGYYTTETDDNGTGTQVIAANGSWNNTVASYTNAGKWIVTSSQTLYAKWSEIVTPTVTVTSTSDYYAASQIGEVKLSITFTNVGATDWKYRVYSSDPTAYYDPDNQTLGNTGTVVKNWVATCGIPAGDLTFRVELLDATNALQATSAPFTLHMETAYAVNLETKTDNVTSTAGGSISTSGPIYPAPHVAKTITANAANSGYSFVNWTASNANITIADPTALSTTITALATGTVYANYSSVRDINVYIYKYGVEMTGTVISATPYIGSAAQTNVTGDIMSTTADGLWYKYTFDDISSISGLVIQWADGGTTGSTLSGVSYSQDIYIYQSGKTTTPTLVTTHDVTVSAGANGSVTPTGTIKVPESTFSIPITATANTNYAFEQWATTGGVTITSGSTRSGTISIQATADGTVSASFDQLVYFVNSDNWENVKIYAWDGDTKSFGEWPGTAMTDAGFDVTIGGVTYDVYSVTGMSETLDGFIFNNGVDGAGKKQTEDLDYSTSLIGKYFYAERCYTADASDHSTITDPGASGTYWYATYDALRAASPSCFDITVKLDGKTESSKTISGGTSTSNIVATVPAWYNFDEWVVERGTATFGSATNPNTSITSASPDAVIKATFTTDKMIYFQNVPGWTNVYVRLLFGDNRWNTDSKDHGVNWGFGDDKCYQMNRIPNTNIYYYNYKNDGWTQPYVAFADHNNYTCNADNKTWLGASNGAYRGDFNTCAPMYVPENYITEYKTFTGCSQAAYYNSRAYWTTYNGTSSGFKLWIKSANNSTTIAEVDMTGTEESRFYTHTVALEAGTGYHVYFQSCAGTYYGVSGNMTPANCSNWNIYSGSQNTYVQTTAAGDYTFTLHCLEDGHLQFSVEYPLNVGDYRVVYEELESSTVRKYHPSDIIWQIYALNDSTKDDTVSFFVNKDANAYTKKLVVERCSSIVGTTITWTPTGQELSVGDLTAGVYNFKLTQSYAKTGDVKSVSSITKIGTYTGDYYVRSDGAYDGWDGHSKGTANTMTYSEASLETQAEFDYYLCKFTLSGTNVKFTVANDYSPCISDTLEGDPLSTDPLYNRQTLPADANIRFMWNSQTNAISRAYVHGSSAHQRYLVLTGDAKVFDEDGDPIAADGGKGLAANELEFQDMGNWVYQVDLQAKSGATAKVSANYNSRISYFVGSSTTSKTVISSEDASTQYALRSVYDFKTNLFWSAWKAGHVASDLTLNTNVLMIRHAQEAANAVTLGTGADVLKVDSAYAAIELRKSDMVGQLNTTANIYTYCMYYISFPFDVKVSDIFGAGSKGIEWELYKYRGDLRAQRGWFAETDSFWEVMSDNDIMEAGTGYVLGLDETIFNSSSASVWTNVADATYIYFPSKDKVGTISSNIQSYTLPSHQCDINRTFVVGGIGTLSHTFTDSHWNMMGIPLFQNSTGNPGSFLATMDPAHTSIGYFYDWSATTNTYTITSTESYTFKTLFGYMTQYTGSVTFTGASIEGIVAAPVRDEVEKHYKVELSLAHEDEFASRTYVELKDGACDTFALCEDVYMIQSSSIADIYTFAGAYDVGANVRSVNSCIIPIGVNVHKAGTYTFSMPSAFTGTVTLIDNFLGTRTDLGLGDYTTSLNKGMDNERFSLELNIERSSATDIEGIEGGTIKDGKAHKFVRDGIMYIFRDGVIYDAMGKRVK